MKKIYLTAVSIVAALFITPAFAQMDMMGSTSGQDQQQQQNQMAGQGMMGKCRGGGGMMGMGGGMMMGHMAMMGCPNMSIMQSMNELDGYLMNAARLGLTQDQKDRIQKIKEETSISLVQKRANLQIAALKLQSLMAKAVPDKQAAAKQIDEISAMWRDMQKMSVNAVIDARNILNPEQRQRVLQYQ